MKLIAKTLSYEDREILVTVPFPDSVELVTDVTADLLSPKYIAGGKAAAVYTEIDSYIAEFIEGLKKGESLISIGKVWSNRVVFMLPYQDEQPLYRATLTLKRRKGPDYPIWSVKLEFSAAKANAAGLVKLIAQLADALPFDVDALIGTFRISRLDAAVDCIGAYPIDLIAHIKKPGKRLVYSSDDGLPETAYLYEKKVLLKPPANLRASTLGTMRLKLYERRAYMRQLHLHPPYGDCPVTRLETTIRWTKKRPSLAELPNINNQFEGRRVAYAAAAGGYSKAWRRFCLIAFGTGVDAATYAFIPGNSGFRAKYTNCAGDVLDSSCWERWADGLHLTGLTDWIDKSAAMAG